MGDRGQSETIGTVLLIGITVVGATVIGVYGSTAFTETRQQMQERNAEQSMKQLDAVASRVALGDSESQRITLPSYRGSNVQTHPDAGWVNISVFYTSNDSFKETVINRSFGKMTYDVNGQTFAYQGGGVFRKTGNNSSFVVSTPEVYYREETMTLPLITVGGEPNPGHTVSFERAEATERVYPNASKDNTNPIPDSRRVEVTIKSEYYDAWADFLETRAGGIVEVDDDEETVTLVLISEPPTFTPAKINAGVVSSGGAGTTMTLDNGAEVASYNSSGSSSPSSGKKGDGQIRITGKIKVQSDAVVEGEVLAGSTVKLPGSEGIDGNVECTEGNHDCVSDYSKVSGTVSNVSKNIDEPEPVGDFVDSKIKEIRNSNDNGAEDDISNNKLVNNNDRKLDDGQYFLDNFDEDQDVVLDIRDGSIEIAVDGKLDLDDADICVLYDDEFENHRVKIYVGDLGSGQSNSEINFDNDADVRTVKKENNCDNENKKKGVGTGDSLLFWVFSPPGVDADFGQGVDVTGVIYAPDSESKSGSVSLAGAQIYGAVVGHVTDMDENNEVSKIWFDTRLGDATNSSDPNLEASRVSYLHITINQVNVTG